MKIRAELIGAKELEAALAQLPKATAKSVLRRALTSAAKPAAAQAQALAPRGRTGNLQASIRISTRLNKRQGKLHDAQGVEVYIGAAAGKGAKGNHAHLLEFGTVKMAARPFLRPAWESTKEKVLAAIQTEVWAALAKSARTLARKAAAGKLSRAARGALGG